jgi:FAD/FMN-containing dehydrogenase
MVTACEFFTEAAHRIVLKHSPGAKTPFESIHPYYVLLELEVGASGTESSGNSDLMEALLEGLLSDELILDATVAATSTQAKELWSLRENITESIAVHGHARKNDISLAVADLGVFIDQLTDLIKALQNHAAETGMKSTDSKADTYAVDGMELVLFGHIGDGNLHINYVAPKAQPFLEFQQRARKIEEQIFALLPPLSGSISAEHGIGLTKKKDLHFSRSKQEVDLMRQIKRVFDPKNLMNPGKIFDLFDL